MKGSCPNSGASVFRFDEGACAPAGKLATTIITVRYVGIARSDFKVRRQKHENSVLNKGNSRSGSNSAARNGFDSWNAVHFFTVLGDVGAARHPTSACGVS